LTSSVGFSGGRASLRKILPYLAWELGGEENEMSWQFVILKYVIAEKEVIYAIL
jgi:hypothetical protein